MLLCVFFTSKFVDKRGCGFFYGVGFSNILEGLKEYYTVKIKQAERERRVQMANESGGLQG